MHPHARHGKQPELRGPGCALEKNTRFKERYNAQIRLELSTRLTTRSLGAEYEYHLWQFGQITGYKQHPTPDPGRSEVRLLGVEGLMDVHLDFTFKWSPTRV